MSASIIAPLVISGSRKADGSANDSGRCWAYLPNTSTAATLYSNPEATAIATQPIVLDEGGRVSAADCPDGLFTAIPIRLYVEDADGNVVSDSLFTPATAATVSVDNDGFPAAETADDVLTQFYTSLRGKNGKFLISLGGTERTIRDKFAEILVSVKDFGAVGNGVAIDTTAIQNAMNYAISLADASGIGSVSVWFPSGVYLIDQALTMTSARVSLRGESSGASQISTSNATANIFTLTSCQTFEITGLLLRPTGANSGSAISMTDCSGVYLGDVVANAAVGAFMIPIVMTSATFNSVVVFDRVYTQCQDNASGRGVKLTNTSQVSFRDGLLACQSGGAALELAGTSSDIAVSSTRFAGTAKGILFTAGMTGTRFRFWGNPTLGTAGFTAPLDFSALATLPDYRQWGNNVDASATSSATGAAQTPVLYNGEEVILTAASGGAGAVTVNAPAILPGTTTADVDLYWDFVFKNAAGGAVTWTMNAIYVLDGATAIPTTAAHTIQVRFRWDRTTSKLRECARSDTLT